MSRARSDIKGRYLPDMLLGKQTLISYNTGSSEYSSLASDQSNGNCASNIGRTMKKVLDNRLVYEILSVVEEIPAGKVSSYGQIAALIGREKNARLVGKVLSQAEFYGDFPCHRVVNHAGRLAPGWSEQRALLEAEGVMFRPDGCVDMKRYQRNGD